MNTVRLRSDVKQDFCSGLLFGATLLVLCGCVEPVDFALEKNNDARPSTLEPECFNPSCDWSKQYGGADETLVTAFAVDSQASLCVGGRFSGKLGFDDDTLSSNGVATFVAILNPDASHRWSKQCTGKIVIEEIATSNSSPMSNSCQLTVAGKSYDPLALDACFPVPKPLRGKTKVASKRFEPSEGSSEPPFEAINPEEEVFLATLDEQGNYLFGQRFLGRSIHLEYDPEGNLYVSGYRNGTEHFLGEVTEPQNGWFVAKFDQENQLQWVTHLGPLGRFEHAVSPQYRIFLVGDDQKVEKTPADGIVLAELDGTSGQFVWKKHFAAAGYVHFSGIDVDDTNDPVVAVKLEGSLDFDNGKSINSPSTDTWGAFAFRLESNTRDVVWTSPLLGTVTADQESLSVHVVKGETILSGTIDEVMGDNASCAANASRLIKLDSLGEVIQNVPLNVQGAPDRAEIAASPDGQIFAAGNFSNTMSLGCGVLEAGPQSALFLARVDAKLNPTGAP